MKYIDADRLKTEIERLKSQSDGYGRYFMDKIIAYIASLQQEQPEVDFEGAYKSYMKSRKDDISGNAATVNVKDMARHFYELGLNSKKEGIVI